MLQIRSRIALPFTLLLVGIILVTAFLSINLIAENAEQRLREQIESASALASQGGFALNVSILERMKQITGADIVSYGHQGEILASTLEVPGSEGLIEVIRSEGVAARVRDRDGGVVTRTLRYGGSPLWVVYRPLSSPIAGVVAFVVDTSDLADTRARVIRTVALVTLVSVAVLSLLSRAIAKRITSPIELLVQHTRALATGDLERRSPVRSADEIGRLGDAFDSMARQLRELEEKVLLGEKLVLAGQMAARVAHDIRNPLSSIKMQAQLLERMRLANGDEPQALATILAEVGRIERVVQGLLDVARPVELVLEEGDVNRALEEAISISEAQLKHRRITLEARLESSLPAVRLDSERLTQAFLHLIQNSAEASPNGGLIQVATSAPRGEATVRIEICDRGTGIDAATETRAFDPFFTTKRDGVGLGLVNARSIVERHGGTIELRSRQGGGACAIVRLPAPPGRTVQMPPAADT